MAKIVLIIAPERFRDEELFITKAELESAGHVTFIASRAKGTCPGSRGGFAVAALTLNEVHARDFDAAVFVGGGGSKMYFADEQALRITREMHRAGKVVAAICLAPVILANAGILNGKKATVAGTQAGVIESKGAKYTGPGVAVDGNVVTANAPKSSKLFGQAINALLQARN